MSSKNIFDINDDNYQIIEQSVIPAVLLLYASWSGPSGMVKTEMEQLAPSFQGKAILGFVNIDGETRDIQGKYAISTVPTTLFFKNGNVVDMFEGPATEGAIEVKLEQLLE